MPTKTSPISLEVTPEERALIDEEARAAGVSRASWVRRVLRKQLGLSEIGAGVEMSWEVSTKRKVNPGRPAK